MKIIRSIKQMQSIVSDLLIEKKEIGFVPTMGYLHDGHLSLMKQARRENDIVVASIFVNPLQFAPDEDFEEYPRDEARDQQRAEAVGVDYLFMPKGEEMYPQKMTINVNVSKRVDVLCGRSRAGHFDGVATVLSKLFNIVSPNRAYFGMKDAQQIAVVDVLIKDLNFPIELHGVETVRNDDRLALSSRNVYLSKEEREEAKWIPKSLKQAQQLVASGEKNPNQIIKQIRKQLEQHTKGKIDYIEVLTYPSLKSINEIDDQVIIACAIYFEQARLIDNIILDPEGNIVRSMRFS